MPLHDDKEIRNTGVFVKDNKPPVPSWLVMRHKNICPILFLCNSLYLSFFSLSFLFIVGFGFNLFGQINYSSESTFKLSGCIIAHVT